MANASGVSVSHTERFGQLNSTTGFSVQSYPIQSGLLDMFPWLASFAGRYETYKFRSLAVKYRTMTPTTTPGNVTIAVDYDAADAAPNSIMVMENWADAVSGAARANLEMRCSFPNLGNEKRWYTRRAGLAANLDIKLYDVGNLYVATEASTPDAGDGVIGYLYADYVVDFYTPKMDFDDLLLGGLVTGATAVAQAHPLGTAPTLDSQQVGLVLVAAFPETVFFSYPGTYMLLVRGTGTVITAADLTAGPSGITLTSLGFQSSAGTSCLSAYLAVVTREQSYFTIAVTATTWTAGSIYVSTAPIGSLA